MATTTETTTPKTFTPPMLAGTVEQIDPKLIDPSPYQNRKAFGGEPDAELADSIATLGVLTPLQVRVRKPGRYELVFGERRLRAAKALKLATVPVIVVAITDAEASERLLVENLQRRDLNALEEAEGFKRLLDNHEATIDSLVDRIGKSKAHVYGRMKLLELAPGPKKALAAGKLPAQQAELIARIADPKLQEQCARIVLGKLDREEDADLVEDIRDGIDHERIALEGKSYEYEVLSYRATKALIRRRFATKLAIATFDPRDADLVPAAGACSTCDHRAGNQPGLPGVLGADSDDLCTRASCFAAKTKAQFDRQAAAAAAAGVKVISAKEAADDIFAVDGVRVMPSSKYVEPTTELPYDVIATSDTAAKAKTWGKLLGKDLAEVPRVLVQDASGAAREMIDTAAAKKLLIEKGRLEDPKAKKTKPSTQASDDAAVKRERDKQALAKLAIPRLLEQVAERAEDLAESKETGFWRWLARYLVGEFGDETVAARRGLKAGKDLVGIVEKLRSARELRALVAELVVIELSDALLGFGASKHGKACLEDGLELLGADWDKSLALAKAARDAEAKSDAAKKDGKPKKASKK